ncbi:MAG: hypothetical protein WCS37_07120 [Chloroflexota bacterium]|nr:hypothetical protein [Chloroflexota bacterium]
MESATKPGTNKQTICQEITRLHTELNELAMRLSISNSPEVTNVWSNLANARAYLSTALEAARNVKNGKLDETQLDWQI